MGVLFIRLLEQQTQTLKPLQKVSFYNIASEASYFLLPILSSFNFFFVIFIFQTLRQRAFFIFQQHPPFDFLLLFEDLCDNFRVGRSSVWPPPRG